ncbi:hypothetical protein ACFQDN_21660 [Pseudomonas asuensis]|uniref:Uncharacterized protein n=1 Tax=Pseudomonas asuensis TaxID=1825787 RepID=A0ABQ2H2Z8_9PSED|nr:hypothetical protein [Pseudomonas asuensis]GGM26414.1 hypothetical protein GCM10009425_41330 [Pseudomonas asuensis]
MKMFRILGAISLFFIAVELYHFSAIVDFIATSAQDQYDTAQNIAEGGFLSALTWFFCLLWWLVVNITALVLMIIAFIPTKDSSDDAST